MTPLKFFLKDPRFQFLYIVLIDLYTSLLFTSNYFDGMIQLLVIILYAMHCLFYKALPLRNCYVVWKHFKSAGSTFFGKTI